MIKILHSADWHLDSPMTGHAPEAAEYLHTQLKTIPKRIVKLAQAEGCDLILLSGDLFDGSWSAETLRSVQLTLSQAQIPVFISPGNHDHLGTDSPYEASGWPENVHIFRTQAIESVVLEKLDCRIYGAGYLAMDCPALLQDFQAAGSERWHLGVFHGEADTAHSDYCPISRNEISQSGLSYLALGHIHKGGSLRSGQTLCAWPGCPMGRGYDELGGKGVILLTLDQQVNAAFLPLDTPRFYDETVDAGDDPKDAVAALLPALPTNDFYRITLTGYTAHVDIASLVNAFPHVPHLTILDETMPEADLWQAAGEDSLEGVLFSMLRQAAESDNESLSQRANLAARICRRILDGQEVLLP